MVVFMNEKLNVTNLSKIFDNKLVLNHINFIVKDGEFLSILGPSGCGKTTLLRILIGLLTPHTGSITKDGTDITKESPDKRGMGIVFQNYALFENMTVFENVEYALRVNKKTQKSAKEKTTKVIKDVGLFDYKDKKPRHLSGGQQQRVAIARTLAMNPDIILFDEPMSALDVATRLSLRRELKEIQKKFGSTMIYITHDQEEAFAMSDRIMVMNSGNISQIDTPENIVNFPADDYVKHFVLDNLQIKINSLIKYTSKETALNYE